MTATTSPVRRFELDWLRVLAIILVFVFHASRFFDPTDYALRRRRGGEFLKDRARRLLVPLVVGIVTHVM